MAPKPAPIVRVSALLPRDLHRRLRRAAFENGLSGNQILNDALEEHLRRLRRTRRGNR